MRIILIMILMLLTGCVGVGGLAPSGVMDYSCEPNCKAKDYYIPGKGVWAKKKTMKKAQYGALSGSAIGAVIASKNGGDPLVVAAASVVGLVVGHEIGTTFDKIDQIHATMVLRESLYQNNDGQNTSWHHPDKDIVVNAMPTDTNGKCREFITSVQVDSQLRKMRGTACLINDEWKLKEIY